MRGIPQKSFIIILCIYAGLRIFIYSSAFPIFNLIDEQDHYDLVVKYANLQLPKHHDYFELESFKSIVNYNSPEYLNRPPENDDERASWKQAVVKYFVDKPNMESLSPPAYYVLAASWYRIGKFLGFKNEALIYWIRFLNIPIYITMILISFIFIRRLYPENELLAFGIPLFLTVIPQSVMYAINNDVLSPLVFGAAFFCLLTISKSADQGYAFYLIGGLLVTAAFLTKYSNVAILAVFGLIAFIFKPRDANKVAILRISAMLPISLWIMRNYLISGDITASAEKAGLLKWTVKPISQLFDHPIFSLKGTVVFWHDLLCKFWRGEFFWNGISMTSYMDYFYSISSLVFITLALIFFVRKRNETDHSLLYSFLSVGISILFLLAISISFDFHNCIYPSRTYPYLTSGRLIFGTIVPFLVLYLTGLKVLISKAGLWNHHKLIMVVMAATISISELIMNWPVFQSPYNLFHCF